MADALLKFFKFMDLAFARVIEALVVVMLIAMMSLVAAQVILRNFFDSGIAWADVASRNMVLWVAFFGAMLATRNREHIAIDALMRVIPRIARNSVRIGIDALACFISFLLARASYFFVLSEWQSASELFPGMPAWIVQAIIPFGFAMISLEYAIGIGLDVWRIVMEGRLGYVAGRGRQ